MSVQTFGRLHPIIVKPSEIRVGDWMRDLGNLRQVESVEAANGPCANGVLVRFVGGVDGQYSTLRVHEHVTVTVWRPMPQQRSESCSKAAGRAAA